jgi:hypothetical protein
MNLMASKQIFLFFIKEALSIEDKNYLKNEDY